MADSRIEVVFGAEIDELAAGIEQMKTALASFAAPIGVLKGAFTELGDAASSALSSPQIGDAAQKIAGSVNAAAAAAAKYNTDLGALGATASTVGQKVAQNDAKDRQEAIKAATEENNARYASDKAYYAGVDALVQQKYKSHEMSLDEETKALQDSETARYDSQVHWLQQTQALYGQDETKYKLIQLEIEKDAAEHVTKLAQIAGRGAEEAQRTQQQAVAKIKQQWQSIASPIESSVGNAITGMITKSQTLQQAMARIGQQILSQVVNGVIHHIVDQWITAEATKTAAAQAGAQERAAVEAQGAAEGSAAQAAAGKKSILNDAYQAAAGVYQSVAQIPYVGWILAPGAAAAAFAAVAAFGSGLASFDVGTNYVPATGAAMIHQGEVILPTGGPAEAYRAGLSGAGGQQPVAVTFNVSAIDGQSVANLFKNNGQTIASVVARQIRNANTSLIGAVKGAS